MISLDGFRGNPILSINPRAKRIIFRFDRAQGRTVIVIPSKQYVGKVAQHKDTFNQWVDSLILKERITFSNGLIFPFKGAPHTLMVSPLDIHLKRPKVELFNAIIRVHGHHDDIRRHMKKFLRDEALIVAKILSEKYAKALDVPLTHITIKDMSSMWGRCLRQKELCYNWRLILAPSPIFEYVAAHEVSHCIHPNHSAAFWKTVAILCPHFKENRAWLKNNSTMLMQYSL
ncbi:MAG: M48 family metallopeptidase [Alphaproteobacteria bacterium]|nr:M48 family metallopeptidase [Alphaproteobacteria bacterium]